MRKADLYLLTMVALLMPALLMTIPCWLTMLSGHDGYNVIMTMFFGRVEQILDVAILTAMTLLAVVAIVVLIKEMCSRKR